MVYSLDGVPIESVPTTIPSTNCSISARYIPAFTRGMAQQQYSLGFIVEGVGRSEKRDNCGGGLTTPGKGCGVNYVIILYVSVTLSVTVFSASGQSRRHIGCSEPHRQCVLFLSSCSVLWLHPQPLCCLSSCLSQK